jgi:mono/diheme cytochrome c family protein
MLKHTMWERLAPARARLCAAILAMALLALAERASADGATEAKRIFSQRCSACHTFGKGVKVGPDLKGVTERRPRAWLLQFIRSSQRMIASGDAIAAGLFKQFKPERMPDWSDLSETQIGAILDWLAAAGPEQREPDERGAETASPAEVEAGRRLFHGVTPLANGGAACGQCHSLRASGGGSFGPDLGHAYIEYQDRAMTLFLKRPCFPRLPESAAAVFLMPAESFALKAFLRYTALARDGGTQ